MIARLPGVSRAPPTPCNILAPINSFHGWRYGAEQRGEREQADSEDEDSSPSVSVAERSSEQYQRRERQQVAVEDPLQRGGRGVEIAADVGQRDVDYGAVEKRHPRAEHR